MALLARKDDRSNVAETHRGKHYTGRGFRVYGEFEDSYGSLITVQESSSAQGAYCWVFCKKRPNGDDLREMSPHLTVGQAKKLRKLLDKFIESEAR